MHHLTAHVQCVLESEIRADTMPASKRGNRPVTFCCLCGDTLSLLYYPITLPEEGGSRFLGAGLLQELTPSHVYWHAFSSLSTHFFL